MFSNILSLRSPSIDRDCGFRVLNTGFKGILHETNNKNGDEKFKNTFIENGYVVPV